MMESWKKTTLKSIITGYFDGPHATPKPSSNGPVFLGIKNVTSDGRLDLNETRKISEKEFPKWTKRVTPNEGDIVLSYEATLHRYAMIPNGFRGCLGRRMALIRIDESVADKYFFFKYMLSHLWRAEVERNTLTGATVDRIPIANLPNFKIFIPPLPTQKKIASILSAYDDLIENNLKRIKLLEEKVQQTYEQWFTRMKFPGQETTPINPDTGLPEGWEKVKLGEVIEISSSKRIFLSEYVESGIPFYRGKEIILKSKNAPLNDRLYISSKKFNDIKSKFGAPQKGDLLITAVGTLGYPYLVTDTDGDFYFKDGNLIWFKGNKSISSIYLISCFKNSQFKKHLNNIAIGSSQKALTIKSLKGLLILKPNKNTSKSYDNLVEPILDSVECLQNQNQHLKEARDILLPRLMTGMIDLDEMDFST